MYSISSSSTSSFDSSTDGTTISMSLTSQWRPFVTGVSNLGPKLPRARTLFRVELGRSSAPGVTVRSGTARCVSSAGSFSSFPGGAGVSAFAWFRCRLWKGVLSRSGRETVFVILVDGPSLKSFCGSYHSESSSRLFCSYVHNHSLRDSL